MRDPEQVARAQHAAARLESAWERWRSLQGLADSPAQPVVGYVGYALKEPWGQPRAVIGFSADEAERLAEFLEHGNSDGRRMSQLASAASLPVKQSSGSGPQPMFTPQPTFTPQPAAQSAGAQSAPAQPAAAKPAATKPAARSSRAHAATAAGETPAPASPAQSRAATKAVQKPRHATGARKQTPLADAAAERPLPASYPVHRVASASYQEPMPNWTDRGRSS